MKSWEFSETKLNFSKPIMRNQGSNWKQFKSLKANWGSNSINWKSGTKIKKTRKFKVNIEFFTGTQSHKIKSLKPIGGAIEPIKNWGTKLYFFLPPKIITRDCTVQSPEQCRHATCKAPTATHGCTQWAAEGLPSFTINTCIKLHAEGRSLTQRKTKGKTGQKNRKEKKLGRRDKKKNRGKPRENREKKGGNSGDFSEISSKKTS